MKSTLGSLRRVFVGLAIVAAFSVAPAMAGAPTLRDTGSLGNSVHAKGTGFTEDNWAYVEVVDDATGYVSGEIWVRTSPPTCYVMWNGVLHWFCLDHSGDFTADLSVNTSCGSGRTVWAFDAATGLWSNPVHTSCYWGLIAPLLP
jgi:hypothetical protein